MVTGQKCETAYHGMDRCLAETEEPENAISFSTLFSGTREHPEKRASITELGIDNFTPEHFLYGVLNGMADELKKMYEEGIKAVPERPKQLIGSGNGLRKNKELQKIFEKMFSMQLKIPVHREEAAFGSALFALTSCGICKSIQDAQKMIKYK
ncbi:hypothetical protein SDC9_182505 [bioreactor metagenome]|uniref:Uncharacterized protein n=1 Tax=bioreactor metagenome TaxID=1076179 RepID=A0A645H7L8_9ZZZZ